MKVLISHSYYLFLDPKEAAAGKPYPPLASITLVSWLRQELGIDAVFYDVMFDKNVDGLVEAIRNHQPDIFILYDDDFNFLTKMCLQNMREAVFEAMSRIDKKGRFWAHGSDASDQAEEYLKAGFDLIINRNAEKTIVALLRELKEQERLPELDTVDGINFLSDDALIARPQIRKNLPLEQAPLPAWDAIDIEPYRAMWQSSQGYFSLNVSTSHGCPFRCNWCAKPLYGRTYKSIPPERVAEEFRILQHDLKADMLWITDDIFALQKGWLSELAGHLEKLNVHIPYKCQNRADLITEELAADLKRTGCQEVWLGVESGSQKILDAMDKDETVETIKTANAILKKHGIEVGFFLQYGYTGEDYEDIKKTLQLVRECLPEHIGISVSYPLKDTPFYERVAEQMGEKKNWKDSGDLAMMFTGKYHPDFYRALHQYTHHYFGFVSIFRPQPLKKRIRRLAAQYKHIPGMVKYKRLMKAWL